MTRGGIQMARHVLHGKKVAPAPCTAYSQLFRKSWSNRMSSESSSELHLFVYGTLRSEGSNAWRMKEARWLASGSTPGMLYRVDWYPAARFDPSASTRIVGELYVATTELLTRLDIFEGAEYERVEITVDTDLGPIKAFAWSYLLSVDSLKPLSHGDWMKEMSELPP